MSPPLVGEGKGAWKLPPEIGLRSCDCRNLSVLACNDRGADGTLVHQKPSLRAGAGAS